MEKNIFEETHILQEEGNLKQSDINDFHPRQYIHAMTALNGLLFCQECLWGLLSEINNMLFLPFFPPNNLLSDLINNSGWTILNYKSCRSTVVEYWQFHMVWPNTILCCVCHTLSARLSSLPFFKIRILHFQNRFTEKLCCKYIEYLSFLFSHRLCCRCCV